MVMLTIGGGAGSFYLTLKEDAKQAATYLWNNFREDILLLAHSVQLFLMELTSILKEEQTSTAMISLTTSGFNSTTKPSLPTLRASSNQGLCKIWWCSAVVQAL
ncbi:hypothetical protein NC651_007281 [Populus alba x Populus x berolinensis]|nr:hypothetical protein NC651_007281 [Populus alba x Populus x berolinensis]